MRRSKSAEIAVATIICVSLLIVRVFNQREMKQKDFLAAFLSVFLTTIFVQSAFSQQNDDLKRFEVGAQATVLDVRDFQASGQAFRNLGFPQSAFNNTITDYGFGGRFTYNINRHLAAEAVVNYLPSRPSTIEITNRNLPFNGKPFSGGSKTQILGGLKYGVRGSRLGIFAKARAGSIRFGAYPRIVGLATDPPASTTPNDVLIVSAEAPQVFFNADVGGVLEYYPSKKTIIRIDAGDTIIRYNPKARDINPTFIRHDLQISVGFGFRF